MKSTFRNPNNPYASQGGLVAGRNRRNKFKPPSLAKINRRANLRLCECPECGQRREAKGMEWCECNPSAPFKLMPVSVSEGVNKAIRTIYNLKG